MLYVIHSTTYLLYMYPTVNNEFYSFSFPLSYSVSKSEAKPEFPHEKFFFMFSLSLQAQLHSAVV